MSILADIADGGSISVQIYDITRMSNYSSGPELGLSVVLKSLMEEGFVYYVDSAEGSLVTSFHIQSMERVSCGIYDASSPGDPASYTQITCDKGI